MISQVTPLIVTPYTLKTAFVTGEVTSTSSMAPRRSTRQLLERIANHQCLYRHSVNKTYYGIKRVGGKRKEHSLGTTDRKIAERKLKQWIANLSKIDTEAEKTTLTQLLDLFVTTRQGMSASTKATEQGLINNLKASWRYGLDIRVSRIRPSMLDEWLAPIEARFSSTSCRRDWSPEQSARSTIETKWNITREFGSHCWKINSVAWRRSFRYRHGQFS